ncbi:hypothetical protein [Rhodopirellula baltica]|uniref:Uncharacterized protein n=1 Tax=Rhodopirellula baltica WH47 TaxID=991778 RepID=F2AN37_RHOBT|nr:hypothetical protein [Rhodopirellula baltica]EGF28920.1 hypothetical protein RBWH47_01327 [Rhodopirellula baltica WH47]
MNQLTPIPNLNIPNKENKMMKPSKSGDVQRPRPSSTWFAYHKQATSVEINPAVSGTHSRVIVGDAPHRPFVRQVQASS